MKLLLAGLLFASPVSAGSYMEPRHWDTNTPSYQHHNDNAPIFFDLATSEKWGYEIISTTEIPWGGRTLDEFDADDLEAYGPVNLRLMRKKKNSAEQN